MKKVLITILLLLLLTGLGVLVYRHAGLDPDTPEYPTPAMQTAAPIQDALAQSPEPSPSPTPLSEEERIMKQRRLRAEEILSGMSQREKICQMMIVYPDAVSGVAGTTVAGSITLGGLQNCPVGGFVFHAKNLSSKEQISAFISTVQQASKIKLFMCADEEGGTVTRLMGDNNIGTTWVEAMYSYKDMGGETAYNNAKTIASDMSALGFNLDLAPVADVWSNPENTVIGDRAYSDSFEQAAQLIPYAVNGFHDGNLLCTLKHFPGHGDTLNDTHYQSAVVSLSAKELAQRELVPFAAGIEAGADMVMIGHMTVLAYDDCPATLSGNVINGLLRESMGFDGVVITDGLGMNALRSYYTNEQITVAAVNAGNDILLGPNSLPVAISAIENALANGAIAPETIDKSVMRILLLKLKAGIIE